MISVTLRAIAPVFLLISLGVFLRWRKYIDDIVTAGISKLVYQVGLPALVFSKIAGADLKTLWDGQASGFFMLSLTLFFILLWLCSKPMIKNRKTWGAFVQAAFRGNTAIVGFAVVQNRYGDHGLALAVMLLAVIIPLYNILAVILLAHASASQKINLQALIKVLISNPLIIALLCGIPFALLSVTIPPVLSATLHNLSNMVLPLALIAIGAELRWHLSKAYAAEITFASMIKLILLPLLLMLGARTAGIQGELLGVMTLLLASPTAVSAYVMAKAMGSDEKLTAQIIVVSTACCIITMAGFVITGQLTGWY